MTSKQLQEIADSYRRLGGIEELEKIRAKIQEFAYYDNNYCGFVLPEWKVSNIIYEYIQELKGEQE